MSQEIREEEKGTFSGGRKPSLLSGGLGAQAPESFWLALLFITFESTIKMLTRVPCLSFFFILLTTYKPLGRVFCESQSPGSNTGHKEKTDGKTGRLK